MQRFIVILSIILISSGIVSGGVYDSKHDLRVKGSGIEPCEFCHTPHKGETQKPLWNQSIEDTVWHQERDSKKRKVLSLPVARICLACHDGNVAQDIGISLPSGKVVKRKQKIVMITNLKDTMNLRHDHPLGLHMKSISRINNWIYSEPLDENLRLFNDLVECATCHSVHNTTPFQPFLSTDNHASRMCLSCHNE